MTFKRLAQNAQISLQLTFDGQVIDAVEGDTIASALLLAGVQQFRSTANGDPRGPFCMMGACYECLVEVNGRNVQSCMTQVSDGMQVNRVAGAAMFNVAQAVSDD